MCQGPIPPCFTPRVRGHSIGFDSQAGPLLCCMQKQDASTNNTSFANEPRSYKQDPLTNEAWLALAVPQVDAP